MKNSKNVLMYTFGRGGLDALAPLVAERRIGADDFCLFFVDEFFRGLPLLDRLPKRPEDRLIFVPTKDEPKTDQINSIYHAVTSETKKLPCAVVGIGGGITLDTAKAISNLLTNGGTAEQYQGWDLVKRPGVYKIGVPTISGTGAESSRTCVMTNTQSGLKLGMNSDHTLYDQLVLDPDLTATVERNQYFFTGVDTYIHCIESLSGNYRNAIADAFSDQANRLSREVFLGEDMKSEVNRGKLMIASYLGGCAIANSFVGVVHPFSAGLSVVLGLHHGVANCMVMTAMEEFYPAEVDELRRMAEVQGVLIPSGVCRDLSDEQYLKLYQSTVMHEKPLANALGDKFRNILTLEKVVEIFKKI